MKNISLFLLSLLLLITATNTHSAQLESPSPEITNNQLEQGAGLNSNENRLINKDLSEAKTLLISDKNQLIYGINDSKKPLGLSTKDVLLKVFFGLFIVLGLITVIAWLSKKTGIHRLANNKNIKLKETLSLTSKEKLVVVDFYGESLLLGVGPGGIALLKSVPEQSFEKNGSSNDVSSQSSLSANNEKDFKNKLNEFIMKGSR